MMQTRNVSKCIAIELNSSSWAVMLDSFGKMVEYFLGKPGRKRVFSGNDAAIKAIIECLNTLRLVDFTCLFFFYVKYSCQCRFLRMLQTVTLWS